MSPRLVVAVLAHSKVLHLAWNHGPGNTWYRTLCDRSWVVADQPGLEMEAGRHPKTKMVEEYARPMCQRCDYERKGA